MDWGNASPGDPLTDSASKLLATRLDDLLLAQGSPQRLSDISVYLHDMIRKRSQLVSSGDLFLQCNYSGLRSIFCAKLSADGTHMHFDRNLSRIHLSGNFFV